MRIIWTGNKHNQDFHFSYSFLATISFKIILSKILMNYMNPRFIITKSMLPTNIFGYNQINNIQYKIIDDNYSKEYHYKYILKGDLYEKFY